MRSESHHGTQHYGIQHNDKKCDTQHYIMLSVIMTNNIYAESRGTILKFSTPHGRTFTLATLFQSRQKTKMF